MTGADGSNAVTPVPPEVTVAVTECSRTRGLDAVRDAPDQADQDGSEATSGSAPDRLPNVSGRSIVGRLDAILAAFEDRDRALSLSEISHRVGLPKSTGHRLAEQLGAVGWLQRSDGGYQVGLKLLDVGGVALQRNGLRHNATHSTITDPRAMRAEREGVRRTGVAIDRGGVPRAGVRGGPHPQPRTGDRSGFGDRPDQQDARASHPSRRVRRAAVAVWEGRPAPPVPGALIPLRPGGGRGGPPPRPDTRPRPGRESPAGS
jgi:hypothetical protein